MNRRYEHDPQPGELPEELKPRQKLDTVSEAIEKEIKAVRYWFAPDGDTINAILEWRGINDCGKCFKEDEEKHYLQPISRKMREALHHISSLSYARGVEDSAMVCDTQSVHASLPHPDTEYRMGFAEAKAVCATAIRSLIPNEKKV